MFYYFKDKHELLEGKLEFKEHNYMFNSYEMELYSVAESIPGLLTRLQIRALHLASLFFTSIQNSAWSIEDFSKSKSFFYTEVATYRKIGVMKKNL